MTWYANQIEADTEFHIGMTPEDLQEAVSRGS
jgi:hypothetical protein